MRRAVLLIAALLLVHANAQADEKAVRALEKAYVDAWVANDEAAVMATVSRDAVIIPSGMQPIRGAEAIRDFWFPRDGSTTTVTGYRTTVDQARVHGDVGWVYGTGELSFVWEKGENRTEASQSSTFSTIARRESDGRWRIVHRAWTNIARR